MRKTRSKAGRQVITLALLGVLAAMGTAVAEWPHFLGPDYDGTVPRERFAAEKATEVWSRSVGHGCSSVTLADGLLYTMGNVDDRDIVYCLEADTGRTRWTFDYPCDRAARLYDGGPNSTPTVADGRLYTLSRKGHIFCLDARTGKQVWQFSAEKWQPKGAWWGFSDSPVVRGDKVFFNVGDAGLALDRETGAVSWSSDGAAAAYATIRPVPASAGVADRPLLVAQTCEAVHLLDPATGESLVDGSLEWTRRKGNCNGVTPLVHGGHIYLMHSRFGLGKIGLRDGRWQEEWLCKEARHGSYEWHTFNRYAVRASYLFMVTGDARRDTVVMCINLESGKVEWQRPHEFANLIAVGDALISLSQSGKLTWGKLDDIQYTRTHSSDVLSSKGSPRQLGLYWPHPVYHRGRLYARTTKGALTCLRLE